MSEWKDVVGHEKYYQVSDLGEVRNKLTGKIIVGDRNSIGYRRVTLCNPHKKRYFVHRLVASHFCDGEKSGLVVNHINGNKSDNRASNLEWVTRSENDLHAFKLGLRDVYPATCRHAIGAYDKVTGDFVKLFADSIECASELKVCRSNIYSCCSGKQKSCRGYKLKYM